MRRAGSMAAVGGDGPPEALEEVSTTTGSASILGADELRLIFFQLLATRNPEKDFGRCARGGGGRRARRGGVHAAKPR